MKAIFLSVLCVAFYGVSSASADVGAAIDVQSTSCKIQQVMDAYSPIIKYYQVIREGKVVFASKNNYIIASDIEDGGASTNSLINGNSLKQAADFIVSMKSAGLCN